jgi:hypothetical protein
MMSDKCPAEPQALDPECVESVYDPITVGGTPAKEGFRVPGNSPSVRKVGGIRTASSRASQPQAARATVS